ncbi:hypothetical protein BDV23DRAFT_177210 [Aspergillus alliaceus]|uniref:RNase III domain-containing protein n=1 Tax=Petromyces alliaceus TaxID=209559 RepID=A0A5N7BRL2_PETAA|nr:hypothetical protein BDV23DRAFT_177210 [Aspergillus alliaceus]
MRATNDFIERVIGYSFKDRQVAKEALQRVRNKRLAFLEDGCSQLQHYACNKEMARQAKRKHINRVFKSDPSYPLSGPLSIHCVATDVAAIVDAVWIDSGRNFEVVKGVMKSLDIYPGQA